MIYYSFLYSFLTINMRTSIALLVDIWYSLPVGKRPTKSER